MSITNLQNSLNGIGDQQNLESGGVNASRLLDTLGERVENALQEKTQPMADGGGQVEKMSPMDVANFFSGIAGKPLAGMNFSSVI